MKIFPLFYITVIFFITSNLYGNEIYPLIQSMDQSNILFKQISNDISSFYRNSEQNISLRPLQIYRIILKRETTIFELAARFNLPYETITTLNRLNQPKAIMPGTVVLIPNTPGLFVPSEPLSDIEYMTLSWRSTENAVKIQVNDKKNNDYYFFPGEKFHKVERSFFLGLMFRFPLPTGIISSHYGERVNPITGSAHFHNGIDIAAPEGTEIMAARAGIIKTVGYNDICGNYIIIIHENNYETAYCHIKKILVVLNQQVQSGMIIATVGTTGMSTGPHLHFEIRNSGESRDPSLMISGKKQ